MGKSKSGPKQEANKPGKFAAIEQEIAAFWKKNDCFAESVRMRPEDKRFTFYDGPPFATGLPHYGHIVTSVMKDMVPRFWTMRGYRVDRRWGWDCHGLPIENIIEKALDLPSRKEIEEYGVEQFNEACRNTVLTYASEWKEVIARLGRWVDMENDYKTMEPEYMESVWWVFKELWSKDMIYEGKKAMHICPRCSTPLSNFEVTLGYAEVEDPSVIWKFPVVGDENTSLLAWTTTPWSTPGTMGLSIGPDFDYVKVKVGDEYLVFAKERLEFVMGEGADYEVVEEMKGSALVGLKYEPILGFYKELPEVAGNDAVYTVYAADYVEVEEGTGIVTINGAYGEIDMEAAKKNGLPVLLDVGMDGAFTEVAGPYAGQYVKDAEKKLIEDMEAAGRIWRAEPFTHSYPHCWRCDTPLLNYAATSWFVKVEEMKADLLANNQKINWVPANVKDGRFGTWLENAHDWAISRSRFWGAPMPIWRSEDGDLLCVGSREELEELSGQKVDDLHKHIVDKIVIEKDGKSYRRIPDVLDCWFESGSMPYAQHHYPFENKDVLESGFPANFIAEGQDQTRGWFYTLHVLATALTRGENPSIAGGSSRPAFENCIVNGIVLAGDGKKMSKRLKNYPDPMVVIEAYGADALRYYLAASPVMDSESLNFRESDIDEVQRKYINTFWNVFTFYQMFAEQESAQITAVTDPAEVAHVLDRWVLDRMHRMIAEVTDGYESYRLRLASRPLQEFVQELSTWYLRRSRDRFKGDDAADRLMALRTLYTVLVTFVKVAAPVTPFITEKVYQELKQEGDPLSVHHCDWPEVGGGFLNESVATTMQSVREIIEEALALRAEAGIKVRQPLQSVTVTGDQLDDMFAQVVREELNVKEVLYGEAVALDTELTEALRLEGALRELVRHTNMQRKKAKLTISDTIDLRLQTESDLVQRALKVHGEEYQRSVLAGSLEITDEPQEKRFKVEGEVVTISF